MNPCLATIFVTAMELSGAQRLMLMWPLCLSIAIVYKTLRCQKLSEIPAASLVLWGAIVFGLYAVGAGLWGLYQFLA